MTVTEELLEALGVEVRRSNSREIQALCPVHYLVKGRPDSRPSWYMNTETGAWLCFSCGQRGSLSHLVELMGGDQDLLEDISVDILKTKVGKWSDDNAPEPEAERVYVSEYAFSKNPYPHKAIRQLRDIRKDACIHHNVRWSTENRCFLLPLYMIQGSKLIGWQEKSKGYFNNVPEGVDKRLCLFGLQQYVRGPMIVMESPLDVVRLTSHGIDGGVATMGSYVSDEQIDAMVRSSDDIILAFDNDDAGATAGEHVARMMKGRAFPRFFKYPDKRLGKDPGELPIEDVRTGLSRASSFVRLR